MAEKLEAVLYQVTEEVLEKLAFIFSFPEEERDRMDYSAAVAASVSFVGPFGGVLIIVISNEALPELAENMLGIDEETTREQQYDALKEMINVVCGNLLPLISGKKSVFNVDAPQIIDHDIDEFCQNICGRDDETVSPAGMARLALDDGQCDNLLFVEGQLPDDEQGE